MDIFMGAISISYTFNTCIWIVILIFFYIYLTPPFLYQNIALYIYLFMDIFVASISIGRIYPPPPPPPQPHTLYHTFYSIYVSEYFPVGNIDPCISGKNMELSSSTIDLQFDSNQICNFSFMIVLCCCSFIFVYLIIIYHLSVVIIHILLYEISLKIILIYTVKGQRN